MVGGRGWRGASPGEGRFSSPDGPDWRCRCQIALASQRPPVEELQTGAEVHLP